MSAITIRTAIAITYLLALAGWARSQDSQPSPSDVFRSQVTANMSIKVVTSPGTSSGEWINVGDHKSAKWLQDHHAHSAFVLVEITPSLLRGAAEYWSAEKPGAPRNAVQATLRELNKKFLPPGQKSFLLVVNPIYVTDYQDRWSLQVGPLAETIAIETLDGQVGSLVRGERSLDGRLSAKDRAMSSLFYLKDVVDEGNDPSYSVVLRDVTYFLKLNYGWARAKNPQSLYFRCETADVHVLSLVEKGIPWTEIEDTYVKCSSQYLI